MSRERSRPWQNPTPLMGFIPIWAGQFDTFEDWVNHATRALTGFKGSVGEELRPFCVDAKGRRCHVGKDFMRARDEDAFPIRYFFTGTVLADASDAGRRQWFIAHLIENEGSFQRKDIMIEFACSVCQASKDIRRFIAENPGVITYNKHRKVYQKVASP